MAKKKAVPRITNMLRPMRISITADDIRKGKALDPSGCAAALAILRHTGAEAVRVHRGVTMVKIKGRWQRYMTSAGLRMETIVFDRGGQFIPGEYDLHPVPVKITSKRKTTTAIATRGQRYEKRQKIPGVRITAREQLLNGDEEEKKS